MSGPRRLWTNLTEAALPPAWRIEAHSPEDLLAHRRELRASALTLAQTEAGRLGVPAAGQAPGSIVELTAYRRQAPPGFEYSSSSARS